MVRHQRERRMSLSQQCIKVSKHKSQPRETCQSCQNTDLPCASPMEVLFLFLFNSRQLKVSITARKINHRAPDIHSFYLFYSSICYIFYSSIC